MNKLYSKNTHQIQEGKEKGKGKAKRRKKTQTKQKKSNRKSYKLCGCLEIVAVADYITFCTWIQIQGKVPKLLKSQKNFRPF